MPKNCAVVGCNSSGRMRERKFYRFPMLKYQNAKSLAITQIRQEFWVRALNRADFPPSRYKHATVCDRHFVSGKSACYTDVENVDWVPSLHLGYEKLEIKIEPNVKNSNSVEHFKLNKRQRSGVTQRFDPGGDLYALMDSADTASPGSGKSGRYTDFEFVNCIPSLQSDDETFEIKIEPNDPGDDM